MKRRTLGLSLILSFVWVLACGVSSLVPTVAPTLAPDRIATGVAEERTRVVEKTAIAATLTTEAKPIITSTSTRPLTLTSTPATMASGILVGKLVGKKTKQPITNATVVLCTVIETEKEKTNCQLRTDMTAITSQDGRFSLTRIPAGTYVVVYALARDTPPQSLNGMIVNYGFIPAKPGTPYYPNPEKNLDMIPDPFGGSKGVQVSGNMFTALDNNYNIEGWIMGDGAIRSNEFALTLEFVDKKAATVQIEDNKTIEIEVWVSGQ